MTSRAGSVHGFAVDRHSAGADDLLGCPTRRRLLQTLSIWRGACRGPNNGDFVTTGVTESPSFAASLSLGWTSTCSAQTLDDLGEPAFRARQVWRWAATGAQSYDDMTDLPKRLRAALAESVPFSSLTLENEAHARDGTSQGAVLPPPTAGRVEAVLMRYRDGRRSLCLSSQSGCPLTCTFCATGSMRFGRNLTSSEILDQAIHFRRTGPVDHAVFMGMGEPMMNLDGVLARVRPAARRGHHRAPDGDLDRRLDPRHRAARRRSAAAATGAVAARRGPGAALGTDARQRPLPARRRPRGVYGSTTRASGTGCSSST